jgi:putative endonuclease
MYYVYVLVSLRDGKRYVGMTENLERRFAEHCRGSTPSTRHRRSLVLVYSERHSDRHQARARENYFKTAAGRRFLDAHELPVDRATRPTER